MLKLFDWSGTASRKSFWILNILVVAVSAIAIVTTELLRDWVWLIILLLALLQLPYVSVAVRRLHDMGRSGFWAILLLIPIVQIPAMLWIGLAKGKPDQAGKWPAKSRHRIAQTLLLAFVPLALTRAFWAPFWVPSGSMKPTLQPGDFFIASTTDGGKIPERGTVMVLSHPGNGTTFVKRVIGLPGDRIQITNGRPVLDGIPVDQTPAPDFEEPKTTQGPNQRLPRCVNEPVEFNAPCLKRQTTETLPNGRSYKVLDLGPSSLDNTTDMIVPDGHVFVMGDNRDNSMDSRLPGSVGGIGMVPIENLQGSVNRVIFSAPGASMLAIWTWRPDRFWQKL